MAASQITVELVYALPDNQRLVTLQIAEGATVAHAVAQSGLAHEFPEISTVQSKFGVFGKRVLPQAVLHDGDRVEIYRPLIADPKEVRRQRAKKRK